MSVTVRPIRNERDYDAALADIDSLMDAKRGTADGDRLDVLVTLVEAYERRRWAIDAPDPIDAIRIRMEQLGMRQRDLAPLIGSTGRVSEVLSRKRPLTLPMIRRLSVALGIRADVLIREVRIGPAPGTRGVQRSGRRS
jgi:HTH-type transcriptional regulator/antitoxin HigA